MDGQSRLQRHSVTIGAMACVLGFLITQQIRTVVSLQHTANAQEGQALSYLVSRTLKSNIALASDVQTLRQRVRNMRAVASITKLRQKVAVANTVAGTTPQTGAGVEVIIHDAATPSYPGEPPEFQLVHDQYVLHIVGVLAGAGATAIAINDQRFVGTTGIYCAGPTIRVNGVPYGSPFVIRAVGPTSAMVKALQNDIDLQGWAQLVSIHYRPVSHMVIPAYSIPITLSDIKPVNIGK